MQHHLAADPECEILAALSRARNEIGDDAPAGAHFYLIKAFDFKPVSAAVGLGYNARQRMQIVEEAYALAVEAGE